MIDMEFTGEEFTDIRHFLWLYNGILHEEIRKAKNGSQAKVFLRERNSRVNILLTKFDDLQIELWEKVNK